MAPTLRILLVDDHGLFAEALSGVLERLAARVSIDAAPSAEAALDVLSREPPFDLVLLDLGLPGLRGRAALDAVLGRAGQAPVVVVTGTEPGPEALELLRVGARGYVPKRASAAELVAVLRFVLDGGTHVPQVVLSAPGAGEAHLTPRQREVLTLLARGAANKDIAQVLGISEATVRVHVSSVMRALGVENRTQAATSRLGRSLADVD